MVLLRRRSRPPPPALTLRPAQLSAADLEAGALTNQHWTRPWPRTPAGLGIYLDPCADARSHRGAARARARRWPRRRRATLRRPSRSGARDARAGGHAGASQQSDARSRSGPRRPRRPTPELALFCRRRDVNVRTTSAETVAMSGNTVVVGAYGTASGRRQQPDGRAATAARRTCTERPMAPRTVWWPRSSASNRTWLGICTPITHSAPPWRSTAAPSRSTFAAPRHRRARRTAPRTTAFARDGHRLISAQVAASGLKGRRRLR